MVKQQRKQTSLISHKKSAKLKTVKQFSFQEEEAGSKTWSMKQDQLVNGIKRIVNQYRMNVINHYILMDTLMMRSEYP